MLAGSLIMSPVLAGTDAYNDLIARARDGETEPALSMLRVLEPVDRIQIRYDHLLIASWAGNPVEAVQIYQSLPHALVSVPSEAHLAAARAWRDLRQWQPALTILTTELYQHPGKEADFASGYIMTLADAGQLEDAASHARHWLDRLPEHVDLNMAMAYVNSHQQQWYDALYHIDKALQLAPHKAWVQREYVFALQRSGMPGPALEWARQHPDLLTPAQLRTLEGDVLAQHTRLGEMPSRNETERFVLIDRTLARYDELIPAWQALGPEADADLQRIRIDRLSALYVRVRMHDLVREYEQLKAEGITLPAWALSDVASAYLYLREPEQAELIYRAVLDSFATQESNTTTAPKVDPETRLENEIGLFYALVESEQFDQIPALLERIQALHGPWTWMVGQPERLPNEHWLEVQQTLAAAHLFADNTPEAQQQLEALVAAAPYNANLHAELAAVYRVRGWPRQAETQLKLAETLSPRILPVETGQGLVALDLNEWQQAEELSADTLARYPEQLTSRRLARLWQVHNKAELRADINRGLASDSPVVGSGEISIGSTIYSVPIHYNWRLFSGARHTSGKYQEGRGHHNQQHAGVEWRSRNLWLEAEISHHRYGAGSTPGARLAAAWDLSDRLQIGATLERLSAQTPLRALKSNIYANTLETYLRWRASERREWQFVLTPMHFSDGNQRWNLGINAAERLHTAPHLTLDLLLDASAQYNSQNGQRPYFNPRQDLMLLPGLRLTQILGRRYETVWEQVASASAGGYQQRGEGIGGAFTLSYGQRYRHHDVLDIGGVLSAVSRPYDGRREHELRVLLDLNYRF